MMMRFSNVFLRQKFLSYTCFFVMSIILLNTLQFTAVFTYKSFAAKKADSVCVIYKTSSDSSILKYHSFNKSVKNMDCQTLYKNFGEIFFEPILEVVTDKDLTNSSEKSGVLVSKINKNSGTTDKNIKSAKSLLTSKTYYAQLSNLLVVKPVIAKSNKSITLTYSYYTDYFKDLTENTSNNKALKQTVKYYWNVCRYGKYHNTKSYWFDSCKVVSNKATFRPKTSYKNKLVILQIAVKQKGFTSLVSYSLPLIFKIKH